MQTITDTQSRWTISITEPHIHLDVAAILDRAAALDLGHALVSLDRRAATSDRRDATSNHAGVTP